MSWTCFKVFVHPDWLIWIWRSPSHNLKSQWKCLAACKEKCLSHLLTKSRNYHSAQQSNDGLDLHITCWSIIQTVATSLAGKLLLPFQLKLTWTSLLVYINKTPSSGAGQLPVNNFVTHCTSWAGASWNVTIHDCLLCIYKKKIPVLWNEITIYINKLFTKAFIIKSRSRMTGKNLRSQTPPERSLLQLTPPLSNPTPFQFLPSSRASESPTEYDGKFSLSLRQIKHCGSKVEAWLQ